MKVVGMWDSPYVRRVVVTAKLMELPIVYERDNRPPDKRHMPWLERVVLQANTAFDQLEEAASYARPWLLGPSISAADVAVACAWRFGQFYNECEVAVGRYPGVVALSARAEALPAFASTPLA